MAVFICEICNYFYDEESEDAPWAELPDDWVCPICGSTKAYFRLMDDGDA